jgi:hypoxanthine phosphoribosyltransferase
LDEKDMGADLAKVLIPEERLRARVESLAAQIDADYTDRELLLVGVLKGAVMIMADLARALHIPVQMDWMAVSSYGSGTQSSGVVRILKDLDTDITNRHVLIVEDIVDSGLTLSWLVSNLRSRRPASLEVCALLRKPEAATMAVEVRYVGFDIPSEFVIGYGLDYAEKYRNLPFVGTLAPHVYGPPGGPADSSAEQPESSAEGPEGAPEVPEGGAEAPVGGAADEREGVAEGRGGSAGPPAGGDGAQVPDRSGHASGEQVG